MIPAHEICAAIPDPALIPRGWVGQGTAPSGHRWVAHGPGHGHDDVIVYVFDSQRLVCSFTVPPTPREEP